MWRIFNGIPRALRAHFHGPRAATGANCVEEEAINLDNDNTCTSSEKESKNQICNFKREEKNCGPHVKWQQADQDEKDWWKRHSCRNDFWEFFNGSHNAVEAVTWGAAVVLGIQLSRPRWRDRYLYDGTEHRRSSFLYQVAFALPGSITTKNSIKGKHEDIKANVSATSNLDKVMKDFQISCKNYSALGKSIIGLQHIESRNMSAAVSCLKESSNLGHSSSQFNLGLCYEVGDGVEKDLDKAMEYYEKAGESGHAEALYNLALLQEDEDTMIELLEKSAEHGLSQAQKYLGVYYSESTDPGDIEKSTAFFKSAADQNDSEAQCFLAMCYERGLGVEVNECKAAELYHKAAQSDNDGAMYNLAVFYEHGLGGLPEDKISAMELYEKAAKAGNEHAQFRLNEMKARSAVDDWKVLYGDDQQTRENPDTRINSNNTLSVSASSPSITDYVRQHLAQLSFTFAENLFAVENNEKDDEESPKTTQRKKKPRPQFILGENEIDDEDYMSDRQNGLLKLSSLNPSSNCSIMGMGRNTTMPELGYIPCP
ncbi:hypothetical protein SNE40_017298 [Patella caerulea]|uniref:Death ligand signal enhancer n=1 Tax=Patella caerulea TaxID=87958 RepID=A0AAN8JA59_PATCE